MEEFHYKVCIEGDLPMDQQATFTVTVGSTPPPPPLTLTPDGGALDQLTVGVAASEVVTVVSGGTSPYNFAISSGAPPDGMTLNTESNVDGSETITLDGTPSTVGDFSFDLDVTDSASTPQQAKVKVTSKKPLAAPKKK
jgi:hypothetical protein